MKQDEAKRLFFGLEIRAPWPLKYHAGRILDEAHRHMTLAFLGEVPKHQVASLRKVPLPSFLIGMAGQFDQCLFLPPRHPRVVAWHIDWMTGKKQLMDFQRELVFWLRQQGFHMDDREFLPHVTICRAPFVAKEWQQAFVSLPCIATHINLYESKGNLQYQPIWQHALKVPIEEIEHTADIAFKIRGSNLEELYQHGLIALAFHYPPLLLYRQHNATTDSLEHIIMSLNETITKVDSAIGCPLKGVSFHGSVQTEADGTLLWEMIVDV